MLLTRFLTENFNFEKITDKVRERSFALQNFLHFDDIFLKLKMSVSYRTYWTSL